MRRVYGNAERCLARGPLRGRGLPVALALALLGPALACAGPDPAASGPGLTRSQFIEAVVAIRDAELAVARADSAQALFEARRDSILAAHGTTEAELRLFLERHSELAYMEEVWDSITQRLKRPIESPRRADPLTEESDPPGPGAVPDRGPTGRVPR
jgi:hypothetical protein